MNITKTEIIDALREAHRLHVDVYIGLPDCYVTAVSDLFEKEKEESWTEAFEGGDCDVQKQEILKILESERIGNINRSRAQATAIVEWLEKKKAGMRDTIYNVLVKERSLLHLDTEEPECANSLRDCQMYADAICTALVPPLQIPPFTDDDADRAFREDEHDQEIARLTKELEEEKVTQCCKRDHDRDGNCDRHPVGWAEKLQVKIEYLTKELEEAQLSRRSLSPGIFVNSKIRQVIVEEIYIRASLYRVTAVSVNCRGKNGMICYEDLKPEELFFTEADCRASVEAVGLE